MSKNMHYKRGISSIPMRIFCTDEVHHQCEEDMKCRQGTSSSVGNGRNFL